MNNLLITALLVLLALPLSTQAAIPERYTNDNYWTSEHDKPVASSLRFLGGGQFYGFTETGKVFFQITLPTEDGTRLQMFAIDDAYHFITVRGIIKADTPQRALAIHHERIASDTYSWR